MCCRSHASTAYTPDEKKQSEITNMSIIGETRGMALKRIPEEKRDKHEHRHSSCQVPALQSPAEVRANIESE
jgi:hypothetical protein